MRKLTEMEKYLIGIIVFYVLLVSVLNPSFFSVETLFDMLNTSAGTIILSMGVLMVLISGGIDVSFASIAIIGAYCAINLMLATGIDNLIFAFIISISIGIVLGICNALLIHFFKLSTLIVTLGTSSVFYGLMTTFVGTKSIPTSSLPQSILSFGGANILSFESGGRTIGLSVFIIAVVAVVVLSWLILYRTMLGRSIFAIGNSEESAARIGISILKTKLFVYAAMGALAGLMGIIYFSELKFVNPISLVGGELMIIAAAVIGGAELTGGKGTIFGTLLGAGIIQLFRQTLVFLGLSSSWNDLFIGAILIASVSVISYRSYVKNRRLNIF